MAWIGIRFFGSFRIGLRILFRILHECFGTESTYVRLHSAYEFYYGNFLKKGIFIFLIELFIEKLSNFISLSE
jgi:hypothetical protein